MHLITKTIQIKKIQQNRNDGNNINENENDGNENENENDGNNINTKNDQNNRNNNRNNEGNLTRAFIAIKYLDLKQKLSYFFINVIFSIC